MAAQCNLISLWKLLDEEVDPMDSTIIVALVSFAGTVIGTIGGIMATNKLVTYRLEQLEKKVDLHNNAVERLFKVEGKMDEVQHDISDLKAYHRPN
jgi:hypothetical protein